MGDRRIDDDSQIGSRHRHVLPPALAGGHRSEDTFAIHHSLNVESREGDDRSVQSNVGPSGWLCTAPTCTPAEVSEQVEVVPARRVKDNKPSWEWPAWAVDSNSPDVEVYVEDEDSGDG